MRIQYASDLHLEFPENLDFVLANPFEASGDILVIAGDFYHLNYFKRTEGDNEALETFIDYLSSSFEQTYIIPGNHEYYDRGDIAESLNDFELKIRDNVRYLNNKVIEHKQVQLIFSTLWTKLDPSFAKFGFSDFRWCYFGNERLSIENYNHAYSVCRKFLISKFEEKIDKARVVITHHLPSKKLDHSMHELSPIGAAFSSFSDDLIEMSNADYWIFGHAHFDNAPMKLAKTGMRSNCLGYVHMEENLEFDLKRTINLGSCE